MIGIKGDGPPQVFQAPRSIQFPVGEHVKMPDEIQRRISNHWAAETAQDPHLFDGPLFTGCVMQPGSDGTTIVSLQQSSYSHYSYGRRYDPPVEYHCTSVADNALLRTSDNYWVVARMGHASSLRQRIKLLGGAASPDDVRDKTFDPSMCVQRD